jgi:hypothetical protein
MSKILRYRQLPLNFILLVKILGRVFCFRKLDVDLEGCYRVASLRGKVLKFSPVLQRRVIESEQ